MRAKRAGLRAVRTARRVSATVGFGLVLAALATEMRKPASARTWHGTVAGVVPYDFRLPQLARIQRDVWNPASDRLLVPRSFGVGWSVNFAAVLRWLRGALGGRGGTRSGRRR